MAEYEQNAFILYTESERKRIEYALNWGNDEHDENETSKDEKAAHLARLPLLN